MEPKRRDDPPSTLEKYGPKAAASGALGAFLLWFLPEYTELKTTVLVQKATIEFHIKTLYEKHEQHKHKEGS